MGEQRSMKVKDATLQMFILELSTEVTSTVNILIFSPKRQTQNSPWIKSILSYALFDLYECVTVAKCTTVID